MKKKRIIIGLIFILFTMFICIPMITQADSGWDNDYGSSSSGYSNSGSYSSTNHDSYNNHGGARESVIYEYINILPSPLKEGYIIILVLLIVVEANLTISVFTNSKNKNNQITYTAAKITTLVLFIWWILPILYIIIKNLYTILESPKEFGISPLLSIIIIISIIGIEGLFMSFIEYIKKYINGKKKYNKLVKKITKDLNEEVINSYDLNQLESEFYEKFIKIQKAWMNFDYDTLKELCSDELFNSYKSDLEVLKKLNQKNIMKKFKLKKCHICSIKNKNNYVSMKVALYVVFKDYVINEKTNEIVKGNRQKKYFNVYELEFIRTTKKEIKCPSCGAIMKGNHCEYCNTIIKGQSSEYVLCNKKIKK